jgi:hypothetical protein
MIFNPKRVRGLIAGEGHIQQVTNPTAAGKGHIQHVSKSDSKINCATKKLSQIQVFSIAPLIFSKNFVTVKHD